MKSLRGQNVLVTGASRGMGVHIASALAREGANLVLTARTVHDLERVADELRMHRAKVVAIRADITRADDRLALIQRAEAEVGQIDVLVNNAGVAHWIPFSKQAPTDIARVLETNLNAPLLLTRLVLPAMIERRSGHVLNIASASGKIGIPYEAAYSASKAGLIEFSNALRMELQGTGVGVSVLCPVYYSSVGGFARQGVPPPRWVGSLSPQRVARAVTRAIRRNEQEVILWRGPGRVVLALNALSPGLRNLLVRLLGAVELNRRLAGEDGSMPKASWD